MKKRAACFALALVLLLLLSACTPQGDTVERFAEANPGSGESIDIPGYETLTFAKDSRRQSVYFPNPEKNGALFVMELSLEDGETLWTGRELSPGEVFTGITLKRALAEGEYAATLHYACFSTEDHTPLNGADVKLTIKVH